jgi:hypothetical protein
MLKKLPLLYSNSPLHNLVIYLFVLSVAAIAAFRIPYLYPVAFILASTWYGVASRQLADSGVQAPDVVVSSELVIACGIASLLLHVAIAGTRIVDEVATGKELSEFSVRDAAYIVSEGLVCAAVAPVIAAVMRLGGLGRTAAGLSSPAEFRNILEEFAKRSLGMAQNMERLSSAIAASAERYENSAVLVSTALEALATDVRVKANGVGLQLSALESQANGLGRSMASTTTEVHKVGVEASAAFVAMNDSIQSLETLLNGMRDLASSVNRFIRPDATADPHNRPRV